MNHHEEHLRRLQYSVSGMKIDDSRSIDRPNAIRMRPSKRSTRRYGSARMAASCNEGDKANRPDVNCWHDRRRRSLSFDEDDYERRHLNAYHRHNSDQMACSYQKETAASTDKAKFDRRETHPQRQKFNNTDNSLRSSGRSKLTQYSSVSGGTEWHGHDQQHQHKKTTVQYNTASNPITGSYHQRFASSSRYVRYDTFDDDASRCTMATSAQALRPSAMKKAKGMAAPQGDVTIIFTDVQGSTSLWEACPTDMKLAQDIHDVIMRQCYANHNGYEITTEGDAFILAFHHPVDALAFALEAQVKLYEADWPKSILKHDDGKDEPMLKFRGFRVRFGVHHGHTQSKVHEMTRRTIYSGDTMKIAKEIESMCHGGQILCSMETWIAVSGMAERYLGRPQILDCGEHLLFETSDDATTTKYIRRIIQLVPQQLAFDFFKARGRIEVPPDDGTDTMKLEIKNSSLVQGRLFPPIISKKQLTTGFLNAPYANGRVTISFMYCKGVKDANSQEMIAKFVRKQLRAMKPPGYECQEDNGCWMLAFDRMAAAVLFGLQLVSEIGKLYKNDIFKIGIVTGPFTSMGPHKTTGMADYFGPIVNRAARVASNCELGQVCVGIPFDNGVTGADPPDFGPKVNVRLDGIKQLKGISVDTAIFSCQLVQEVSAYY